MRSFEKMVKEKKIKILTFVVLLFVVNGVYRVKGIAVPQLLHVIRDGRTGLEGLCIAKDEDAYSAVDWTYPIPAHFENLPITVTYFLPNITSDFDCNFEKDQACLDAWKLESWFVPRDAERNFEAVFDHRWEDLKTYLITNTTQYVDTRIDILHDFNVTLSVRSDDSAKILLCEGWLPQKHACYAISLGGSRNKEVILKKNRTETILDRYENKLNILSFDQWKSFQISLSKTGRLVFSDLVKNVTLIEYDDLEPLKPIFLFMSSVQPSLWKIHTNHFLYTNTSISTKFGPSIKTSGSDVCISMYVSLCSNCSIIFYEKTTMGTHSLLKINGSEGESDNGWKLVKVIKKNHTKDDFQLYVTTKSDFGDGFWMIDNVRLCTLNEIKIVTLGSIKNNTNLNIEDPLISCHVLWLQQWRPRPYRISSKTELPLVSSNESSTSLKLSWKSEKIFNNQLPYLIEYQGYHLCPSNYPLKNISRLRLRSKGWLVTTDDEIAIENLIPYTSYWVVFKDPVYEKFKNLSLSTNETENITKAELPQDIKIKPRENSAELSFRGPSCNDIYGRILYKFSIYSNDNGQNSTVSVSTNYLWRRLDPYTNYSVTIETSRNIKNFNSDLKAVSYYNFMTKPDIAPPLSYLETYETSENSVAFRYNLSRPLKGIPKFVSIYYYNSLMNRNASEIVNVTKCIIWKDMFCSRLNNLMPNYNYIFMISIKNENTNTFGKETTITAVTKSREPGVPSNLKYDVMNCSKETDYCNLKISWDHPYNQSGVITAFELELKEVGSDLDKIYPEILLIDRKYQSRYSYVINYLPYAIQFNLSVRAVNNHYKGGYASILGKMDHIGQHIDQMPKIIDWGAKTVVIEIPRMDVRLNTSVVFIIVQSDRNGKVDGYITNITDGKLCNQGKETWIATFVEMSKDHSVLVTIGDGVVGEIHERRLINKELELNTKYCMNYVIKNTYKTTTHTIIYHHKYVHLFSNPLTEEPSNLRVKIIVIVLALLALLIVIGLIMYRIRHRLCAKGNRRHDGEHIYEAMPFDEYNELPNVAYNAVYDKLDHK